MTKRFLKRVAFTLAFAIVAISVLPVAASTGSARVVRVYQLHTADATDVAAFLAHAFPAATIDANKSLNALSVIATEEDQQHVAEAIGQLDGRRTSAKPPMEGPGGNIVQVVPLRAAIPSLSAGQPSSSAAEIQAEIQNSISSLVPDLRVTAQASGTQLILTGSPASVSFARQLIAQLDVAPKLVLMDVQMLEVDEQDAKNLGLEVNSPVLLSTTYTENVPTPAPGGTYPPLLGLQGLTRTPLSLGFSLNLLLQKGKAKVLADPRIVTVSGRTATIRSGDNISVQTTTGGSAGTVATTQLQTFQTGVTLEITPIVNDGDFISVSLHPAVNSLQSTDKDGIPQISTRDTIVTVSMQAGQSLVIGGLIEDLESRNEQKFPILGDLPLVGKLFTNTAVSHSRNDLVITVTPHIITRGQPIDFDDPLALSTPTPLPQPAFPSVAVPPAAAGRGRRIIAQAPRQSTPAPGPTPSAFAKANNFIFGTPPQNNQAGPYDQPKIYYLTFEPTVLHNGDPVLMAAITSSNVVKLTIAGGSFTYSFVGSQKPGFWTGNFAFHPVGLFPGQTNVPLTVTATKQDGTTATLTVPVSLAPQ